MQKLSDANAESPTEQKWEISRFNAEINTYNTEISGNHAKIEGFGMKIEI